MIKILLGLFLALNLYANIKISQNIRALYKDVKLTEIQKNYILDSQDYNIYQLEKILKKEFRTVKSKYINERNVISFVLTPSGKINNIKFLRRSDNRKVDNITKKAINKTAKKFKRVEEDTIMRYIISFKKGRVNYISLDSSSTSNRKPYYQNISQGTTRFQHSSKEYVREFETTEDGFVNVSVSPAMCATVKLLTYKNQKVHTGYSLWKFNTEIAKGKYKLLIKTKKLCNVSIEYL